MLERYKRATTGAEVHLNPYLEAARESANVLGLTGLTALSLATLNPLPLLVGAVAEAAYLVTVPDTGWYRKRVSDREAEAYQQAVLARRQALEQDILHTLAPRTTERYNKLVRLREQIDREAPEDGSLYNDIFCRLDEMIERFLVFAQTDARFRAYLRGLTEDCPPDTGAPPSSGAARKDDARGKDAGRGRSDARDGGKSDVTRSQAIRWWGGGSLPNDTGDNTWVDKVTTLIAERYKREQGEVDGQIERAADDDSATAVLTKRREVLQYRIDNVLKIGKDLTNLNNQMDLLEDTFGMISDQIRARPPKEVLSEVEDVVLRTNLNTEVLDSMSEH